MPEQDILAEPPWETPGNRILYRQLQPFEAVLHVGDIALEWDNTTDPFLNRDQCVAVAAQLNTFTTPLTIEEDDVLRQLLRNFIHGGALSRLMRSVGTNEEWGANFDASGDLIDSPPVISDADLRSQPTWTVGRIVRNETAYLFRLSPTHTVTHDYARRDDPLRSVAAQAAVTEPPLSAREFAALIFALRIALSNGEVEAWRRHLGYRAQPTPDSFLPLQENGEVGRITKEGSYWRIENGATEREPFLAGDIGEILDTVASWTTAPFAEEYAILAFLAYRYLPYREARDCLQVIDRDERVEVADFNCFDPIWETGRIGRNHDAYVIGGSIGCGVIRPLTPDDIQNIVHEVDSWEEPLTLNEAVALHHLCDASTLLPNTERTYLRNCIANNREETANRYDLPSWRDGRLSRNRDSFLWSTDSHSIVLTMVDGRLPPDECRNLASTVLTTTLTPGELAAFEYILQQGLYTGEVVAWMQAMGQAIGVITYGFLPLLTNGTVGRIRKLNRAWVFGNSGNAWAATEPFNATNVRAAISAAAMWPEPAESGELEILAFLAYLHMPPVNAEAIMRDFNTVTSESTLPEATEPAYRNCYAPYVTHTAPALRTRGIRLPGQQMPPPPKLVTEPATHSPIGGPLPEDWDLRYDTETDAGNPTWTVWHKETDELIGCIEGDEALAALVSQIPVMQSAVKKLIAISQAQHQVFRDDKVNEIADALLMAKLAEDTRVIDEELAGIHGIEPRALAHAPEGEEDAVPVMGTEQATLVLHVPRGTHVRLVDGDITAQGPAPTGTFIYVYNPDVDRGCTVYLTCEGYVDRNMAVELESRTRIVPIGMLTGTYAGSPEVSFEFISNDGEFENAVCGHCAIDFVPGRDQPALLEHSSDEEDDPGIHLCSYCYSSLLHTAHVHGRRGNDNRRFPISELSMRQDTL